jgi:PAS domain S-box-containing protein
MSTHKVSKTASTTSGNSRAEFADAIDGSDKLRLLLVDDDEDFALSLADILENKGFEVEIAHSLREGRSAIDQYDAQVALVDIQLGNESGIELISQLKAINPSMPCVILTAHAAVESAIDAMRMGAFSYKRKPVDVKDLLSTLEQCFEIVRLERKMLIAQQALSNSEEKFRSFFENASIGMVIASLDGEFTKVNKTLCDIIGYAEQELLGKSLRDIIPADNVEGELDNFRKLIEGESNSLEHESVYLHKNGTPVWVVINASLVCDSDGRSLYFIAQIQDITVRKKVEQLLRVQDRMASLGRVAAGMAHEIRNPLSGVNLYLNALAKRVKEAGNVEGAGDVIDKIYQASNRIETIIRRVMDFSKPSEPRLIESNANYPIEDAINLSAALLARQQISLEKDLDNDLPQCSIDPLLFSQVIVNLIANASDALKDHPDEKKMKITSRCRQNTIEVRVSDSGPGIPLKLREEIFIPFYSTKEDGTGIGLSICHRIVIDHQGSLYVAESKWGGAEFVIEIPLKR